MQPHPSEPTVRPPVLLGCASVVFALVLVVFGFVFVVEFLESGANTGKVALNAAASYAPATVTYVPNHNLYVVRLADGTFLALSDLDAANRASATRCHVVQLAGDDPLLGTLLQQYGQHQSAAASGSNVLLREGCHHAVYDVAGMRLDDPGAPNLDRLAVSVDGQGRLVVDLTKRVCTQHIGAEPFSPIRCPA